MKGFRLARELNDPLFSFLLNNFGDLSSYLMLLVLISVQKTMVTK